MIKQRHCRRCSTVTEQEISRRISANLAEHFGWWCLMCHWWSESSLGGLWIPKETLEEYGVDLSTIRTVVINESPRCVKCGTRGAELHHWAPQAIFGQPEADGWPKDYLCLSCHQTWHRKVTPQLV